MSIPCFVNVFGFYLSRISKSFMLHLHGAPSSYLDRKEGQEGQYPAKSPLYWFGNTVPPALHDAKNAFDNGKAATCKSALQTVLEKNMKLTPFTFFYVALRLMTKLAKVRRRISEIMAKE